MQKFFNSAGKFLIGIAAALVSIIGIFSFFSKSDSDALSDDDDLAEDESNIDDRIEELENQDEVEHQDPNKFWDDL